MPISRSEFDGGYVLKDLQKLVLSVLKRAAPNALNPSEVSNAVDRLDPKRARLREAQGKAILSGNLLWASLAVFSLIGDDGIVGTLEDLVKNDLVECRVIGSEKYYRAR